MFTQKQNPNLSYVVCKYVQPIVIWHIILAYKNIIFINTVIRLDIQLY